MKRTGKLLLSLVLVAAFALAAGIGFVGMGDTVKAEAADNTLVIYNWGDYIDESVTEEFEVYYLEMTGKSVKVIYSTFDTNESMLTTLEQGKESIDLVCPSEYAIQRLMQRGLIQKLDKSKLTNLANVDARIYDKVNSVFTNISVPGTGDSESMSDYFIPYMWGTLGILYNTNYVTEADIEAGYGILWNAAGNSSLKGKILMKDSIRDAYVAAVLYMKETGKLPSGYENLSVEALINTLDDTMLEAAEKVFKDQKDVLAGYEVDDGKTAMQQGTAYVDLAWSGDALYVMDEVEGLDYYVPKIGGNIWFDGWVIPKNAQNVEAAYMFLDYLCRPDVAMKNSMYIGYTSAISPAALQADSTAMAILADNEYTAEEFFGDEIRYPDMSDASLGVMKDFGDRNADAIAMWVRVKSPDDADLMWILWLVLGILGAAAIGVAIYFILRKKGSVRRVTKAAPSSSSATLFASKDDSSEEEESEDDDSEEISSDEDSDDEKQ